MRILALVSLAALASCGYESSGLALDPAYTWPSSPLNVCFDDGPAGKKAWVRDAIERTWAAASALEVTWLPCGELQEVHFSFYGRRQVNGIGVQLNHLTRGIVIGGTAEHGIRSQAVFAFGLALGFVAGQDRGDGDCHAPQHFPDYADVKLGRWDPMSAMNECRPTDVLSPGDMTGIRWAYGPRSPAE